MVPDARRSGCSGDLLEIRSRQIDEEYIRAFDESRTIGPFSGFVEAGRGRFCDGGVALIAPRIFRCGDQRLISRSRDAVRVVAASGAERRMGMNANADVDADVDEVSERSYIGRVWLWL